MPDIPMTGVKKTCMSCRHWGFKYRPNDGTAYCFDKEDWLPDQRGWVTDPKKKKPGERIMSKCWERRIGDT